MALQEDVWQGAYAESLVDALAVAAGLNLSTRRLDFDGVDRWIGVPGRLPGVAFPAIEVQIKSWKSPVGDDEKFRYPLKARNHDFLIGRLGDDLMVPRLLLLVVVPPDVRNFAEAVQGGYLLRGAVYWANLMGAAAVGGIQQTKTVDVPKSNLVTSQNFADLIVSFSTAGRTGSAILK